MHSCQVPSDQITLSSKMLHIRWASDDQVPYTTKVFRTVSLLDTQLKCWVAAVWNRPNTPIHANWWLLLGPKVPGMRTNSEVILEEEKFWTNSCPAPDSCTPVWDGSSSDFLRIQLKLSGTCTVHLRTDLITEDCPGTPQHRSSENGVESKLWQATWWRLLMGAWMG